MWKEYKTLIGLVAIVFILGPVFGACQNANAASVVLNWNIPTLNCDGSNLDDPFGYVILWGTTPGGPYPNEHSVDGPLITSASVNVGSVENVTLYFVTVTVDTSGNRSDDTGGCGYSNEIQIPFGTVLPSPPTGLTGVAQ